MNYEIHIEERKAGDRTGPVVCLHGPNQMAYAEIWTAHGFNCLRWQVPSPSGLRDVLYRTDEWEANPVPTRSGVPILFPFPNRIRDAKFRVLNTEFELPRSDASGKHAIHGFAPRNRWRVVDQGTDEHCAWVTGQFRPALDAPDVEKFWPADYVLSVTYRLQMHRLSLEIKVMNPSDVALPFGLGFHPYFRFPLCEPDEDLSQYRLFAPADSIWGLQENLPTGAKLPVPAELDWGRPRLIGDTKLDTVYTDLGIVDDPEGILRPRAQIRHAGYPGSVQIWASPDFRESVLFTPAHRKAVCIEPYTCVTDAVHLQERGIDAGWRSLPAGEEWIGFVEFRWDDKATGIIKV